MAQVHIATQVVEYLHTDANGSVVATTDSAGELIGTVEYSPYGEPTSEPLSALGYAGEWTDDTTGHVYLRARWLDVETGAFLSEDPMVQITMNSYGYTEGNPLSQIDPLGLFSWNDFGAWVHENSAAISVGLTTAGILASATGLGAPVGILITSAGTAVSLYSAGMSYKEGDISSAAINAASAIPGIGFLGASFRSARMYDKASDLSNTTKSLSRYEARNMTLPSRTLSSTYDDMMITTSVTGSVYDTTAKTLKGLNQCA